MALENWSTQIKKGYLELCVLSVIRTHKCVYGFQLIRLLEEYSIPIKEGTLYPMLNRMSKDKVLKATWETKDIKGHPRKFYSLMRNGEHLLERMQIEFAQMYKNYVKISFGAEHEQPRVRKLSS